MSVSFQIGHCTAVLSTNTCGTLGLYPGLTENQIMEVLDNTIRAAGMEPFFDIVLFGEIRKAQNRYSAYG